jgi:excisionase family DNA binding protein
VSENDTTASQSAMGELPAVGDTSPAARTGTTDHGTTLTLPEAAERLEMSVRTLRRMVQAGQLEGAYLAPGKYGETWQVPVATVEQYLTRDRQKVPTATARTQQELDELRHRVQQLEHDLELQRALADERRHQLEQLHMTMRMLTAAQAATPAPQPEPTPAEAPRKRWWRRS